MLAAKGMRFPIDVILISIRWYAAHPLNYRNLEETIEKRGVSVEHSSLNRWAIRFLPLLEKAFLKPQASGWQLLAHGRGYSGVCSSGGYLVIATTATQTEFVLAASLLAITTGHVF